MGTLLCVLSCLTVCPPPGEDVWSYAKTLPHLFQRGGVFYNIVRKDMGAWGRGLAVPPVSRQSLCGCVSGLLDGKHCTLPHLGGKTFVFNAAHERLELCVDTAGHFHISPDVEERVKAAAAQGGARGSREGSPAHGALRLGGGGVVRKKEQQQSAGAFQGRGHSLGSGGSSPPEHRPITRQHSSGTDLSASVSRGAPDLSQIPEDATRELVRMAPGFVTSRDGGGLDPGVMEQQRRKLQEMVSSIQASMERHLKEQVGASRSTGEGEGAQAGKAEDLEEMESQNAEQSGAAEPMDHS